MNQYQAYIDTCLGKALACDRLAEKAESKGDQTMAEHWRLMAAKHRASADTMRGMATAH